MNNLHIRATAVSLAILMSFATVAWSGSLEFGEPVQISASGVRALAPDIVVDADGRVHLLWVEKGIAPDDPRAAELGHTHLAADELFYSRGFAGLGEFTDKIRVNNTVGEVWGFSISKPELVLGGDGTIHIAYPANAEDANGKSILAARYTRSTDGGDSFESSQLLNSQAGNDLSAIMHGGFAAAHAFGTLVASGESDVHVYWIDTRYMIDEKSNGALYKAVSRDSGASFADDEQVFEDEVCPCCQLAAAAPDDRIYLTSRQAFNIGSRDSAVAVSQDRGKAFGERVRLGEGRWMIEGCPLKRTAIAADGDNVYTAWYTAGQEPAGVYFARSTDAGKTYSESRLLHPDALVSDAPSIAVTDDGEVFVAWHAKTGGPRRVYVSASADGGESFSAPQEVPAPEGTSAYPEIAAGAGGEVYLAWLHDDAVHAVSVERSTVASIEPVTADGLAQALEARLGQVVLVNFWATWCRPCLKEIPELMELADKYGARGFALLPVSLDDPNDIEKVVRPFLSKWFPDLATLARLESQMDAMVSVIDPAWNEILPTSYLLRRDGSMAHIIQGGKSGAEFEAQLMPLLN